MGRLKEFVEPVADGRDVFYKLNKEYFHRGDAEQGFTKLFIKATQKLLPKLNTNAKSLLLLLAVCVDPETRLLVDASGRKLRQTGIGRLMGWKDSRTTQAAIAELKKHGVITEADKTYSVSSNILLVGEMV